jgi:WhiB family redox-sensing transcriptional regulator
MTVTTLRSAVATPIPASPPAVLTGPLPSLEWQEGAACRGTDTELFYLPDAIRGQRKRNREAAAKAVCAGCPVVADCLRWAMTTGEPYGVWGGTTPEERELLAAGIRFAG